MNRTPFGSWVAERRLDLADVLPLMVADGYLTQASADELQRLWEGGRDVRVTLHPLVWLAGKNLPERRDPSLLLTL